MAELSYPNPSVTQVQHERLMGGASGSGVFGGPTDPAVVYAPDSGTREIRIRANRRAVVEGYGWESDASEVVKNLAANSSGSTRVDLVVLRLNRAGWTVTVQVVQGTPGAGAPAPTYGTASSGVWELPLAEVTVDPGATTIASSKVKNRAWYVGSDGQIRCTPDTRPQHEAGRAVWDTTYGYLVSTGGTWLVGVEDSGAVSLPLASLWSAGVNVLHRRNGWTFLSLSPLRTGGSVPADTVIKVGTLPAGFRPATLIEGLIAVSTGDTGGRFSISSEGIVNAVFFGGLPTGRYANFQAISFPNA